jgi:hypothetical protein
MNAHITINTPAIHALNRAIVVVLSESILKRVTRNGDNADLSRVGSDRGVYAWSAVIHIAARDFWRSPPTASMFTRGVFAVIR